MERTPLTPARPSARPPACAAGCVGRFFAIAAATALAAVNAAVAAGDAAATLAALLAPALGLAGVSTLEASAVHYQAALAAARERLGGAALSLAQLQAEITAANEAAAANARRASLIFFLHSLVHARLPTHDGTASHLF